MSSYVFMKVLESAPERYDLGLRLLSHGRIADVYEKTNSAGATLDFVVLETEGKDAADKPVFYSRNILISKRV